MTLAGTGKTYTAFQIVYRLLKSGTRKRILYLADRNILVDQSIQQDFAPLEKTIHKIDFAKDNINKIMSYEINFALYHQMVGQNDEEHFRFFPPEFFDLIIVDDCEIIGQTQGNPVKSRGSRWLSCFFDRKLAA